jgi:aryl-alcohol dehydrogenase-like predicted oxidoreductase
MTLGHADDLPDDRTVAAMEAHAHAVLDAAWACGIRWVDAARSYGRAEHFLASWLAARGVAPGTVTVSSKWGYEYVAGWRAHAEVHEVKRHDLAQLERQLAESRALLGAHLAVYQIHSATRDTGVLEDAAVLDRLARLRDDGVRVGLSVTGPAQANTIRDAIAIERGGRRLFDVVQATWNALEPGAGGALAEAHGAGMTVIVKEALANGRLTDRNADPAERRRVAPLLDLARELGVGPDAVALAAVLARPWADVVLTGAATAAQLRENVRALDVPWTGAHDVALRPVAMGAADYWRSRGELAWG